MHAKYGSGSRVQGIAVVSICRRTVMGFGFGISGIAGLGLRLRSSGFWAAGLGFMRFRVYGTAWGLGCPGIPNHFKILPILKVWTEFSALSPNTSSP